jgi:hypothetical protein
MAIKSFKKLYMASFFLSGVSIVFGGLFGSIYLLAYPYHSNPCDGLTNPNAKPSETTCPAQVVARGYKSTTLLVEQKLLPSSFPFKTAGVAPAAATYSFCKWNPKGGADNKGKCEESPGAAGTGEICFSETDSNDVRKNRHGEDGKCESSRVPEICKQTGFNGADDQSVVERLVRVGTGVEIASALFLTVTILGTLSFLNILAHQEYGKCPFCNLSLLFLCKFCIDKNYPCAKKNRVGGRFKKAHESCGIFYTLFFYDLLIIVSGIIAIVAYATLEEECYGAKDKEVYGDGVTARDYLLLEANKEKDAHKLLLASDPIFITFTVFLGLTVLSAVIKAIGFAVAEPDTDDMNITLPENMECCPGGNKGGSYGSGSVQLRGDF